MLMATRACAILERLSVELKQPAETDDEAMAELREAVDVAHVAAMRLQAELRIADGQVRLDARDPCVGSA